MRVEFLGGADEIGASAIALELKESRLLIDCGVRFNKRQRLPGLAGLQDGKELAGIILTHAHLDHSGALPVVKQAFPSVPIYMTPPTFNLIRILLGDTLKLMESKWELEKEIPLYAESAVSEMLQAVKLVHYIQPTVIKEDIRFTFFPAGHIAGAASVGIETKEGNVFITGDISVNDQLTVAGMPLPDFDPHLIISESTYGSRLHADRDLEETRLVKQVQSALEADGKVLIPAFALGRAQEVILTLQNAMRNKKLPKFPIHVDGMVKNICSTYRKFPFYLTQKLKKEVQKRGDPFFDSLKNIKPVMTAEERMKIIEGPPCCIVASSGMLTGGPSQFYAQHFVQNPENMIAVTGYQDEESPGRKLLNLADGKERKLKINGESFPVKCRVDKYNLSAHADGVQISGLIWKLEPNEIILVHGDGDSRGGLAELLGKGHEGDIHQPVNGEFLDFDFQSKATNFQKKTGDPEVKGISRGKELNKAGLKKIAELLDSLENSSRRLFSVNEIMEVWYGVSKIPSEKIEKGMGLIEKSDVLLADSHRPFLYRINQKALNRRSGKKWRQGKVQREIKKIFPKQAGLYKCGVRNEENTVILYFYFPRVAAEVYKEMLKSIEMQCGWKISVNPETHQGALKAKAEEMAPAEWQVAANPSIHRESGRVTLKTLSKPDSEELKTVQKEFKEATGFDLIVRNVKSSYTAPRQVFSGDGKMEINAAFREVDRAFAGKPQRPYRKSRKTSSKGPYIELSFISGKIGERYRKMFRDLEKKTGWKIYNNPRVNQELALKTARDVVPDKWRMKRNPSYLPSKSEIRLHLVRRPSSREFRGIQKKFQELTGLKLSYD